MSENSTNIYSASERPSVLVSGGSDSSLIAYYLATNPHKNPRLFTFGQTRETLPKIEAIVQKIHQKTGYLYPVISLKGKPLIKQAVEQVQAMTGGVVFTGCNLVIDYFTPRVHIPGDTPPVRGEALNERHLRPFIHMDKVQILSQYKELDLLDLFALTHSCGLGKTFRCGGCYFCMERAWACHVLRVED